MLCSYGLMGLDAKSVRGLFCTVSANRHGAPPPRLAPRVVDEEERTSRTLAGLDVRKVLRADELSQRFRGGEQKRVGAAPPTQGVELEWPSTGRSKGNTAEGLVALEQAVERLELGESLGR